MWCVTLGRIELCIAICGTRKHFFPFRFVVKSVKCLVWSRLNCGCGIQLRFEIFRLRFTFSIWSRRNDNKRRARVENTSNATNKRSQNNNIFSNVLHNCFVITVLLFVFFYLHFSNQISTIYLIYYRLAWSLRNLRSILVKLKGWPV